MSLMSEEGIVFGVNINVVINGFPEIGFSIKMGGTRLICVLSPLPSGIGTLLADVFVNTIPFISCNSIDQLPNVPVLPLK